MLTFNFPTTAYEVPNGDALLFNSGAQFAQIEKFYDSRAMVSSVYTDDYFTLAVVSNDRPAEIRTLAGVSNALTFDFDTRGQVSFEAEALYDALAKVSTALEDLFDTRGRVSNIRQIDVDTFAFVFAGGDVEVLRLDSPIIQSMGRTTGIILGLQRPSGAILFRNASSPIDQAINVTSVVGIERVEQ